MPRRPTTQAQADWDALKAIGDPDEITYDELCARGLGKVYNDGIVRTDKYKLMHQAFLKLCKNFTYPSLVQRRKGHDGKNVSSFKKGPNMDLFIKVCQHMPHCVLFQVCFSDAHPAIQTIEDYGVVVIHDICTQDQAERHVWYTFIHVICRQCLKKEHMLEIPVDNGRRRLPVCGRTEVVEELKARRREVLDFLMNDISLEEAQKIGKDEFCLASDLKTNPICSMD